MGFCYVLACNQLLTYRTAELPLSVAPRCIKNYFAGVLWLRPRRRQRVKQHTLQFVGSGILISVLTGHFMQSGPLRGHFMALLLFTEGSITEGKVNHL